MSVHAYTCSVSENKYVQLEINTPRQRVTELVLYICIQDPVDERCAVRGDTLLADIKHHLLNLKLTPYK